MIIYPSKKEQKYYMQIHTKPEYSTKRCCISNPNVWQISCTLSIFKKICKFKAMLEVQRLSIIFRMNHEAALRCPEKKSMPWLASECTGRGRKRSHTCCKVNEPASYWQSREKLMNMDKTSAAWLNGSFARSWAHTLNQKCNPSITYSLALTHSHTQSQTQSLTQCSITYSFPVLRIHD